MFKHYLPNKNECTIIAPKSKFSQLNKGLVCLTVQCSRNPSKIKRRRRLDRGRCWTASSMENGWWIGVSKTCRWFPSSVGTVVDFTVADYCIIYGAFFSAIYLLPWLWSTNGIIAHATGRGLYLPYHPNVPEDGAATFCTGSLVPNIYGSVHMFLNLAWSTFFFIRNDIFLSHISLNFSKQTGPMWTGGSHKLSETWSSIPAVWIY